mmetsp:Transcript_8346/g.30840  ORF Transcript_8346/g.30840 Transcript_8346/m.30840 type:complete len:124 (+) Transcript_8346:108-479(+)
MRVQYDHMKLQHSSSSKNRKLSISSPAQSPCLSQNTYSINVLMTEKTSLEDEIEGSNSPPHSLRFTSRPSPRLCFLTPPNHTIFIFFYISHSQVSKRICILFNYPNGPSSSYIVDYQYYITVF